MLTLKISIDDGRGKKADVTLNEVDHLAKLVIIQNVFNLFGIEKDLLDQIKTFDNASKAYSQFFNETNPIEPDWENTKIESIDIKQELISSYEENKEALESTYNSITDQPETIRTNTKIKDGKTLYQLRYSCPACWNKGTHFVHLSSKKTWCHRCYHEMIVQPAHNTGDITLRDTFC